LFRENQKETKGEFLFSLKDVTYPPSPVLCDHELLVGDQTDFNPLFRTMIQLKFPSPEAKDAIFFTVRS
jgi:hypothetical protein